MGITRVSSICHGDALGNILWPCSYHVAAQDLPSTLLMGGIVTMQSTSDEWYVYDPIYIDIYMNCHISANFWVLRAH